MTIQEIISKTLKRLDLEGKLHTPDFYAEAFCKEATKAGMQIADCSHIDKFTKSLNKEFQKELAQYRIKTMGELVRFLISKLNRTNPSICSQTLEAETLLLKRVLQVVDILHNKEVSILARKSLEMLSDTPNIAQIEHYRQLWVNFLTNYDDTFLKKLGYLGDVDHDDLRKTIENLHIGAEGKTHHVNRENLSKLMNLFVASLVPSIASSVNEKIAAVSEKIKNDPNYFDNEDVEKEIRSVISLRIALDKKSVKEMIASLDGILDKLSLRLIDMIERSDGSNVEIQKIKKELESYNEKSNKNFRLTHKKLYTIAIALEENTQLLSSDLKSHKGEINSLKGRVQELEHELQKSKEESRKDFLTQLYNKRALDEFLETKEGEFQRYNHNFSIVMFDLDHFKQVNDSYGHEAGDAVLMAFSKILLQESRNVDIVGRYGGEEFIAILSETDAKGGAKFAEKVRKHVENARFMYKGNRIAVTVSAGASERKKFTSFKQTINSADEYLYKAKRSGRNRVEYK